MQKCLNSAEHLPDDNTFELKLNKVGALLSSALFCLSLQSISCLFLLLTTNLLARSTPTGRKTVFAWQERSARLNNGSSCEIWQQRLTFGTPCFLPRLIYVSRLRPVPHQEEVFLKNKCVEENRENSQHYAEVFSLCGSWKEGWSGAWPVAESSFGASIVWLLSGGCAHGCTASIKKIR